MEWITLKIFHLFKTMTTAPNMMIIILLQLNQIILYALSQDLNQVT